MKFRNLPKSQLDEIMLANQQWTELVKANPEAINTTVGVITNPETGKVWRPKTVEAALVQAEERVKKDQDYGYQTQAGHADFLEEAQKLVIGDHADILAYQTAGGTRALSLARDTVFSLVEADKIPLVVDTGWPNYNNIFGRDFEIMSYEHQDYDSGAYDHRACLENIRSAGQNGVVILQIAGYNNDGLDRTEAQWDEIIKLTEQQQNVVILDAAYLGLAQGMDEDVNPIRKFIDSGLLTLVCFSVSKIMGLYAERLGALFIVNTESQLGSEQSTRLDTMVKRAVRGTESSNSRLIGETGHLTLKNADFLHELETARQRLVKNRQIMTEKLGNIFPQISGGSGLFAKLYKDGFTDEQIKQLQSEGIHVLPSSRLNFGGMNQEQATKVAEVIAKIA